MTGPVGDRLTIGTFARRSRLSPKALRLYDRIGLLSPAYVEESNRYRYYAESQLETARLVVLLRRLEMPLSEVAAVVEAPPAARSGLVEAYWTDAVRRHARQSELVDHLRTRLSGGAEGYERFEVQVRDVPAQRVLNDLRRTTVMGLSDWIGPTLHRFFRAADELGLPTGSSIVIFHGEVNEDSDGPVEICLPVFTTEELPLPNRIEPAHREAYTTITVAQVEFPQILSAYEAVERWLLSTGAEPAGSPREVYVDGFHELGPTEAGCDIAFPIKG